MSSTLDLVEMALDRELHFEAVCELVVWFKERKYHVHSYYCNETEGKIRIEFKKFGEKEKTITLLPKKVVFTNHSADEIFSVCDMVKAHLMHLLTSDDDKNNRQLNEKMKVKTIVLAVNNGHLRATIGEDLDCPGINVEFIPDAKKKNVLSNPKILMEVPKNEEVRVFAWTDKTQKEYTEKLTFK